MCNDRYVLRFTRISSGFVDYLANMDMGLNFCNNLDGAMRLNKLEIDWELAMGGWATENFIVEAVCVN